MRFKQYHLTRRAITLVVGDNVEMRRKKRNKSRAPISDGEFISHASMCAIIFSQFVGTFCRILKLSFQLSTGRDIQLFAAWCSYSAEQRGEKLVTEERKG